MVFLAPVLSRVLDAAQAQLEGRETPQSLRELAMPATAFVNEGIKLFETMSAGIVRTPEVEELFRQIHLEQQAQVEALEALALGPPKSGLARAMNSLRSASERLLELFPKLQEEEAKDKVYSPFPVVDHTIRVGLNVLAGKASVSDFEMRLPSVARLVPSLRKDVERFKLLYGRKDLADLAETPLGRMEAGLGASFAYMGNAQKHKTYLEDCLRLLGSGSAELIKVLQRFDDLAQSDVRFHRLRYLEELGRAQGSQPAWLIERVWSGVQQVLDFYQRELFLIRQNPLFFEIEPYFAAVHKPLQEALRRVGEVKDRSHIPDGLVGRLQGPFDELDTAFARLKNELKSSQDRFQEAPNFGVIRELVGRTLNGEISGLEFLGRLDMIQKAHHDMLTSLGGGDEVVEELAQLTRSHTLAYARMRFFPEDGDAQHLIQGWHLIALSLPRILTLSQQLRERLGVKPTSTRPVIVNCPKCGGENPKTQKFCLQCNAIMPQATQEVTDYMDIMGPAPQVEAGTPANLATLDLLVQQVELRQITRGQLKTELQGQLEIADKVRQNFEKQVTNLGGRNPSFDTYADFFGARLKKYINGLQQMDRYAEGAEIEDLRNGFALVQAAGRELKGFQSHIQDALRGKR